ncbi:antitoxin MazE family protein [Fundidesulfovibrio agrisoli]|uniref:antitoxin MazE family protein n=1 Tax=Fundidesulfovibrio agrisoli TaxID=2922717 RepID=UPI001FABF476|nr:antitoxin MazE family protein [Fundidesulfovibrio agrisoli]
MQTQSRVSPSQKMKLYRARMKQAGLRAVQIWVPDTRSPVIAAELRRQCRLASQSPEEGAVLDFLEGVSAWDETE